MKIPAWNLAIGAPRKIQCKTHPQNRQVRHPHTQLKQNRSAEEWIPEPGCKSPRAKAALGGTQNLQKLLKRHKRQIGKAGWLVAKGVART